MPNLSIYRERLHPIFVHRPIGGRLEIRWYCIAGGRCHGRDFYNENRICQKSLRAQAQQLANKGHLRSDAGHYCDPPFEKVYEITPHKFRFFGFRSGDVFYITNAGWKDPKRPEPDMRFCEKCRIEFLDERE